MEVLTGTIAPLLSSPPTHMAGTKSELSINLADIIGDSLGQHTQLKHLGHFKQLALAQVVDFPKTSERPTTPSSWPRHAL